MAIHNDIGQKGEQLAVKHLISSGYDILEQNYRSGKIEVDIIASKGETLAVVEVKTRTSRAFGSPQDFVKPKQIAHLIKVMDEYVQKNNLNVEVRFDIIAITLIKNKVKLEHLEDAFYHF